MSYASVTPRVHITEYCGSALYPLCDRNGQYSRGPKLIAETERELVESDGQVVLALVRHKTCTAFRGKELTHAEVALQGHGTRSSDHSG